MMRHETTVEHVVEINGRKIWLADIEVAVELEPDESVGCSDYWIANVYVEGFVLGDGKTRPSWHEVPRDSELAQQIAEQVQRNDRRQLDDLWRQWVADIPSRKQITLWETFRRAGN